MNEKIKAVMSEKRIYSIGQLVDLIISGDLRRELGLNKAAFSDLIGVNRLTLRSVEGLELTPSMRTVLNTAVALRIGIKFPECDLVEVSARRNSGVPLRRNSKGQFIGRGAVDDLNQQTGLEAAKDGTNSG